MYAAFSINSTIQNGQFFVQLEPEEEGLFKKYCKEVLGIEESDVAGIKKALSHISDPTNENHTNGVGRFIPIMMVTEKPDPLDIKRSFGWLYIKTPETFTVREGVPVEIKITASF